MASQPLHCFALHCITILIKFIIFISAVMMISFFLGVVEGVRMAAVASLPGQPLSCSIIFVLFFFIIAIIITFIFITL